MKELFNQGVYNTIERCKNVHTTFNQGVYSTMKRCKNVPCKKVRMKRYYKNKLFTIEFSLF